MARTISAFLGDQQDVHLDSRSSLGVATGLEDVRQRVVETLKLWRGEWFLDTTRGVPYADEIFRRPAVAGLISSAISSAYPGRGRGDRRPERHVELRSSESPLFAPGAGEHRGGQLRGDDLMAVVDQAGISPTDLAGYVERLEALLRDALGADLDLAPETPQGQLAGLFGLLLAEIDEGLVNVANGMSHHTAAGSQLDDWGSLLGIPRITGERSTVTATLSGAAGTVVPAGSRVETTEGAIFRVDTDVVIGASDSVDALMRSAEAGPIVAEAGTLTRLVDIFSGWTGVTNVEDAALGRADESDADYRARYRSTVAHRSGSGLEAIRARVLQVDGVNPRGGARQHDGGVRNPSGRDDPRALPARDRGRWCGPGHRPSDPRHQAGRHPDDGHPIGDRRRGSLPVRACRGARRAPGAHHRDRHRDLPG